MTEEFIAKYARQRGPAAGGKKPRRQGQGEERRGRAAAAACSCSESSPAAAAAGPDRAPRPKLARGRRSLAIAQVSPASLGDAARDQRVRRPHLGRARRARAPRPDRRALGFADRDPRDPAGDPRGGRTTRRFALVGREPAGAGDRPEHPAAERAAAAAGAAPGRRQPGARAAARRGRRSTSSTSTSRSRPAPARRRCATRSRSTSRTFHEPAERVLSTQVARHAGRDLLRPDRRAHGEQRGDRRAAAALLPGRLRADPARRRRRRAGAASRRRPGRVRIAYCAEEERGALRLLPARAPQSCPRTSTGRA